eukprot:2077-Chlamydomonas_euryale.AAC.9
MESARALSMSACVRGEMLQPMPQQHLYLTRPTPCVHRHAELNEEQYQKEADTLLDMLHDAFEEYIEDLGLDGGDVEYSQGVLTVKVGGGHGTFVLNKQTPNRQIWLSSPVSGPLRFDWHGGKWVYRRDHRELLPQLEAELKGLTGVALSLTRA